MGTFFPIITKKRQCKYKLPQLEVPGPQKHQNEKKVDWCQKNSEIQQGRRPTEIQNNYKVGWSQQNSQVQQGRRPTEIQMIIRLVGVGRTTRFYKEDDPMK